MGNLSPAAQSKLLTALEKRRIVRLGGTCEIPIDVRLICATNADLHAQVTEGTFRQDLFYRINTVEIHIPPLRERGEDIQLLADISCGRTHGKYQEGHPANRTRLKGQAATVCLAGQRARTATCHRTRRRALQRRHPPCRRLPVTCPGTAVADGETLNLEALERNAVEKAVRLCEGNMSRAAQMLGITRYSLYRKLEKLGL